MLVKICDTNKSLALPMLRHVAYAKAFSTLLTANIALTVLPQDPAKHALRT